MPRSRRTRSKLNAVDDDRRSAIYDLAKQRMKNAGGDRTVHQPVKGAENMPAKTPPSERASRAGVGVNRTGNARRGQSFRIKEVKGGTRHVYGDGTSVFVRAKAGPAKGRAPDARAQTIQRLADQRRITNERNQTVGQKRSQDALLRNRRKKGRSV